MKGTKRILIEFNRERRQIDNVGEVTGRIIFCGDFDKSKIIGTGAFAELPSLVVNADRDFCEAHVRELQAMFHCAEELFSIYGHD